MGYTLATGQKAPILDQDGVQIPDGTLDLVIADETIVSLTDVGGGLGLVAVTVGVTAVTLTPHGGAAVSHDVTVTDPLAGTFDWTLGDPI